MKDGGEDVSSYYNFKGNIKYWKLKGKALDRFLYITDFRRGYG